jgi:hypothetical protein
MNFQNNGACCIIFLKFHFIKKLSCEKLSKFVWILVYVFLKINLQVSSDYDMIQYDIIRYMIWYDMIWYDTIRYDMIWYMIWYDMIWYDTYICGPSVFDRNFVMRWMTVLPPYWADQLNYTFQRSTCIHNIPKCRSIAQFYAMPTQN